jgi:hypothetical protein
MTTLKLKTKTLALMFALLLGITSCSDDSDNGTMTPTGTLNISASATYSGTSSRNATEVSRFLLNLEEIELEFDDDNYDDDDDNDDYGDYDDDGFVNADDEIELEGPFEIDVLSTATTNLVTLNVPQAIYEELEFEFDDNENPNSDLFGKTVLMEGNINGTPFEFWYDFEAEVEIDYEDSNQDIDVNAGLNAIIINFDLDNILNQVDLSQATDTDEDGLIEINPNGDDGNASLAQALKDAIKDNIELLDDSDDDD